MRLSHWFRPGHSTTAPATSPPPVRLYVEWLEDRTVPSTTLDPTFAFGGKAVADFGVGSVFAAPAAVEPDGKIVVAGSIAVSGSPGQPGYDTDFAVVRLNPDGTRDTTFGTNGRVTIDVGRYTYAPTPGALDEARGVAIDSSGRILVAGDTHLNAPTGLDFAVVRLLPNGDRDPSFGGAGVVTYDLDHSLNEAAALALDQFGRILVGGGTRYFDSSTGVSASHFALLRLFGDGSLDRSFGGFTHTNVLGLGSRTDMAGSATLDFFGYDDFVASGGIAVRPNGKIVLGGSAGTFTNNQLGHRAVVAQFNPNGSLDTTFGPTQAGYGTSFGGQDLGGAGAIALLSDGSVVQVGSLSNGSNSDFAIARYTDSGFLDQSFGTSGIQRFDFGYGDDSASSVAVDAQGRFVVAGTARVGADDDMAAIRLDSGGRFDPTFGNDNKLTTDFTNGADRGYGVVIQPDGKVVLTGIAEIDGRFNFAAVRYAAPTANTADSDGDGLLDVWETNGIDVNGDGVIDLNLPALGANPSRPDVFVEIDAMVGRSPSQQALTAVVNAFAQHGITLHPLLSDPNLPLQDWPQLSPTGFPVGFDQDKAVYFGEPAERSSPNWPNIRTARSMAVRYCIFANSFGGTRSSGIARTIVGQDFTVTLQGLNLSVDAVAGTFMHELGHSLGLHHNGNTDANYNPNYLSVMNYLYQLGINDPANRQGRLPNHPDYAENNSPVYPDWMKLVFNWRTGPGASAGLDFPRPTSGETDDVTTIADADLPVVADGPPSAQLIDAARAFAHSPEHFQQFVINAYQQYLKRLPDAAGLQGWVSAMLAGTYTDEQVEAFFIGSQEYIASHGGTGQAWVTGMYQDLLGRTPSAAEVQAWVNTLNAGTPPAGVALGFAASPEREAQRVRFNYQTYLGRTASQAEVDEWVNAFVGGVTNEEMVAGFVGSPEYYLNAQKGRDNQAVWVARAYLDVLSRAASVSEVNLWLRFLGQG
jgi:uncharacterized delta-60 repeat protein